MEQMQQLEIEAKSFKKWYDQVVNAETFEQADEAKVEGLKAWLKYTQQLNRVRGEFLNLSTDTRARLNDEVRNRVQELVQPTPLEQAVEEHKAAQVETPAPKKTAKKTTKKVKK